MAKNTRSMYFDLFGRDKSLGKTMKTSGKQAESLGSRFKKSGLAMAAGFGIAAIGVERLARNTTEFFKDSVANAADAQASQLKLGNAFKKFDLKGNISQLRDYNSALEMKVGIDDDEIASAQTALAGFGLTYRQIKKLTPLMADYAKRTGKDVAGAAKDLGKAVLGSGGPLKKIGITFKDLKDPTKNFDQLVQQLTTHIGGTALKSTESYSGQLNLMKVGFGEVKESIGRAFLPTLITLAGFANKTLIPALQEVADTVGPKIAGRLGKFADLFKGLKGGGGLKGLVDQLAKVSPLFAVISQILPSIQPVLPAISKALAQIGPALIPAIGPLGKVVVKLLPALVKIIVALLPIIPPLAALIVALAPAFSAIATEIAGVLGTWVEFMKLLSGDESLTDWLKHVSSIPGAVGGIFSGLQDIVAGAVNTVIDGINGVLSGIYAVINAIRKVTGMGPLSVPRIPHLLATSKDLANNMGAHGQSRGHGHGKSVALASGGIAMPRAGGTYANIAEAGVPEAVIPLSPQSLRKHGLGGGGGDTYQITISGLISDEDAVMRKIYTAVKRAKNRGAIPGNAFA